MFERLNSCNSNGHEAIANAHLSATLTLLRDFQKRKFLGKFEDAKLLNFYNHNDLSGTHSIMNFKIVLHVLIDTILDVVKVTRKGKSDSLNGVVYNWYDK